MTPDEARASLIDLYVTTRDSLGGTWTLGSQTWLGCELDDGREGAIFALGAQRLDQPLAADPKDVARWAQGFWASRGIPAETVFDSSIDLRTVSYPRLGLGPGPGGYIVQLTVGDDYVAFTGESRCVPGDSYELDVGEIGRTDE